MVRPVVHSIKHYVQFPFNQIGFGVREVLPVARAMERSDVNIASEVAEGSIIKALYLEMWLQNEGNESSFIATLSKDPEDGTGPTSIEMAGLFSYTNKKNVLWTSQGLSSNDAISGPVNIVRQWFKIPKSKQRFGLGDKINLNISNTTASSDLNRCGFAIYKEYS